MALYAVHNALIMRVSIQTLCAFAIALRTGAWWPIGYAAMLLLMTTLAVLRRRAYWRSQPATHDRSVRDLWLTRFAAGEWCYGAICGASSIVLLLEPDPYVGFPILLCNFVLVTAASVGMSAVPVVASGHVVAVMVPLAFTTFFSGSGAWIPLGVFGLVHIMGCRDLTANAHRQILEALIASERNAELAAELADTNRKLEDMVITDGLTGLVNRRGLDARLLTECAVARRSDEPLSLLLLDVDRFKAFNDRYGHQNGDDCLRRIAAVIGQAPQRPSDVAARYGGEEFAIVLPGIDAPGAGVIAEHVRQSVEAIGIEHAGAEAGRVTVSIGVVTLAAADAPTPASLLRAADQLLYAAKQSGRNRVATSLGDVGSSPAVRAVDPFACEPKSHAGIGKLEMSA